MVSCKASEGSVRIVDVPDFSSSMAYKIAHPWRAFIESYARVLQISLGESEAWLDSSGCRSFGVLNTALKLILGPDYSRGFGLHPALGQTPQTDFLSEAPWSKRLIDHDRKGALSLKWIEQGKSRAHKSSIDHQVADGSRQSVERDISNISLS
jgi:hypothetical protein